MVDLWFLEKCLWIWNTIIYIFFILKNLSTGMNWHERFKWPTIQIEHLFSLIGDEVLSLIVNDMTFFMSLLIH